MSAPDDVVRVVAGNASDEEVAALVTALAAAVTRRGVSAPAPLRSRWADPSTMVRAPLAPGPGGWVAAAWRR